MKKSSKLRRNLLCFMVVCTLIFQFYGIKPSAASSSWKLKYVYGAPSSASVSVWHKSVTTTKKATRATISAIDGGAKVFVYSSNGIGSIFYTTGHTEVNTVAGKIIQLRAEYTYHGSSSNTTSGTFSY